MGLLDSVVGSLTAGNTPGGTGLLHYLAAKTAVDFQRGTGTHLAGETGFHLPWHSGLGKNLDQRGHGEG